MKLPAGKIIRNKSDVNIGDRVIYIKNVYGDTSYNPLYGGHHGFIIGTVTMVWTDYIEVAWDNETFNSYRFVHNCLKIFNKIPEQLELFE